ncbi:MAG: amino acid ABC transporter permease [Oscillospiraceae bacterium]|nr:amino acid ABC transporter permease [Oscillospiraceae bacterium]
MIQNIWKVLQRYPNLFLVGTGYTLLLSAITVVFSSFFGSLLAIMRRSRLHIGKFYPLRFIGTIYVEIVRGTPMLLQLYFFYFLLPAVLPFLELTDFQSITVACIVNSTAYVAEIIRAGIDAVDKGQTEAARSLGLNGRQTMIRVVLPQAVKNILPALCNEFVSVIKETSLASTFFVGELMTQYKTISGALYLPIEPLIIVGLIYFILTFTLSKFIAVFERRLKSSER